MREQALLTLTAKVYSPAASPGLCADPWTNVFTLRDECQERMKWKWTEPNTIFFCFIRQMRKVWPSHGNLMTCSSLSLSVESQTLSGMVNLPFWKWSWRVTSGEAVSAAIFLIRDRIRQPEEDSGFKIYITQLWLRVQDVFTPTYIWHFSWGSREWRSLIYDHSVFHLTISILSL